MLFATLAHRINAMIQLVHSIPNEALTGQYSRMLVTPKGRMLFDAERLSIYVTDFVPSPVPQKYRANVRDKEWLSTIDKYPNFLISQRPDRDRYMRLWNRQLEQAVDLRVASYDDEEESAHGPSAGREPLR